ncbi:MAG: hypothetical protein HRT68_11135, partial [Flavobacteriaceae bacterium]|nr:hypothetical protein [Flavobacteriaceae bacterium]
MSSYSDEEKRLRRKVKSGKEFDNLFPKVTCKKTFLPDAKDTYDTLVEMRKISFKYQLQGKKIAKVLQQRSLAQTVNRIHDFLYNNFQYKLDKSDQLLRSLACSWYWRKKGIDCKSFSIATSTILLNLGIKHYFR